MKKALGFELPDPPAGARIEDRALYVGSKQEKEGYGSRRDNYLQPLMEKVRDRLMENWTAVSRLCLDRFELKQFDNNAWIRRDASHLADTARASATRSLEIVLQSLQGWNLLEKEQRERSAILQEIDQWRNFALCQLEYFGWQDLVSNNETTELFAAALALPSANEIQKKLDEALLTGFTINDQYDLVNSRVVKTCGAELGNLFAKFESLAEYKDDVSVLNDAWTRTNLMLSVAEIWR